jgi:hypothetical protein
MFQPNISIERTSNVSSMTLALSCALFVCSHVPTQRELGGQCGGLRAKLKAHFAAMFQPNLVAFVLCTFAAMFQPNVSLAGSVKGRAVQKSSRPN